MDNWRRHLGVFVTAFATLWLFLDPLDAFGLNLLNLLGIWGYLSIFLISLLVTLIVEVFSRTRKPVKPSITSDELGTNGHFFSVLFPTKGEVFSSGSVITANGNHSLAPENDAWAILSDTHGHYYLQNPPVTLNADGTWRAKSIHLGHDITDLIFVLVTSKGNKIFQRKVKQNDWGAFSSLPSRTRILANVEIQVK